MKLPSFHKIKNLAEEFNPTYYAALKSAHSWLPPKSLAKDHKAWMPQAILWGTFKQALSTKEFTSHFFHCTSPSIHKPQWPTARRIWFNWVINQRRTCGPSVTALQKNSAVLYVLIPKPEFTCSHCAHFTASHITPHFLFAYVKLANIFVLNRRPLRKKLP